MIRYIKTDDSGWVDVLKSDNTRLSLCAYTKVEIQKKADKRTYFKLSDGPHQGLICSMKDTNASTHLSLTAPTQGDAILKVKYGKLEKGWYSKARDENLDQQMATMSFASKTVNVTLNSVWDETYTPIPAGTYKILIPDRPHDKDYTQFYRDVAPGLRYDQVWFPIEYDNNTRYVHVGNLSEGCVTVLDLDKWNKVYEHLIKHRASGGKHVGKLEVTK